MSEMRRAGWLWKGMVAEGTLEEAVTVADGGTLCEVEMYLTTQAPGALVTMGRGLVENEMIERFMNENRNGGAK